MSAGGQGVSKAAGEQGTEMTVRTCRWCGCLFAWPKGSRQQGCPRCAPQLFDHTGKATRLIESRP